MDRDADGRPQTLFKTLRRLHGQDLNHAGLNDLNEAFAAFVTRARFFATGRLRRTWSHSAVEFMKYRRRLPALLAPDDDRGSDDEVYVEEPPESARRGSGASVELDCRRVFISNVPYRVTCTQLASFFSKFGRVASCNVPSIGAEDVRASGATLPRRRSRGIAYVSFRSAEDALRARAAPADELRLYDRTMAVSQAVPSARAGRQKRHTMAIVDVTGDAALATAEDDLSLTASFDSQPSPFVQECPDTPTAATPFDLLPDDVFLCVLSQLDMFERVRVERVAKRWLEMSLRCWRDTTTLGFSSKQFSIFSGRPLQNGVFGAILYRCGPYLKTLDLSATTHLLDERALRLISKHCISLKSLDLTGLRTQWRSLKQFSETCARLEAISFRNAYGLNEKAFWYLLRSCANVRRVDLSGARRLTGRCFRLLGRRLEQLQLSNCTKLLPEAIEEVCLKAPNLQTLNLDDCAELTDEAICMLCRCLNSLQSLSLCGFLFKHLTPTCLAMIGRLHSLRRLALDDNRAVTDDVLLAVAEGCPRLQALSLASTVEADTANFSAQGLCAFQLCRQLEHVNLSHVYATTDAVVAAVAGGGALASVRLRGCRQVGDAAVDALVGAPRLTELDVSGCVFVSTAAVQRLVDARPPLVGAASGRRRLRLVVGGTSCSASALTGAAERGVSVDATDNCVRRLCSGAANEMAAEEMAQYADDDGSPSDDDFAALAADRSYVLESLDDDDDDDLLDADDPAALLETDLTSS